MEERTVPTTMFGFTPIPDGMVEKYGLVVAAVWGKMWRYCQMRSRICEASQSRIAHELKLSRKTVNKSIDVLVEAGYFEAVIYPGRPNEYRDTGKASLHMAMQLVEEDQPVTVGYTTCNRRLHLPVTVGYTKKVLRKKKETLRAEKNFSDSPQGNSAHVPEVAGMEFDADAPEPQEAQEAPLPLPVEEPRAEPEKKMDALDMFMAGIIPERKEEHLTAEQYKERIKIALQKSMDGSKEKIPNLEEYPEDVKDVIRRFCELWSAVPPSRARVNDKKRWIQDSRNLKEVCAEFGLEVINRVRKEYDDHITVHGVPKYTIEGPGAMIKWASTVAQTMRASRKMLERDKSDGFFA